MGEFLGQKQEQANEKLDQNNGIPEVATVSSMGSAMLICHSSHPALLPSVPQNAGRVGELACGWKGVREELGKCCAVATCNCQSFQHRTVQRSWGANWGRKGETSKDDWNAKRGRAGSIEAENVVT